MMDILDKIKEECRKHTECAHCKLYDFDDDSCQVMFDPAKWDIVKIRNVLEESVGEKNIVVPDMMPSIYTEKDMEKTGYIDEVALYKIDEVIMCLQQIKERLK